jgi:hypothetical protein
LVGIGFTAGRLPRADDTNSVYASVRVSNEQQASLRRFSDRNEPSLVSRVIWVIERLRQRVQEDRRGLIE